MCLYGMIFGMRVARFWTIFIHDYSLPIEIGPVKGSVLTGSRAHRLPAPLLTDSLYSGITYRTGIVTFESCILKLIIRVYWQLSVKDSEKCRMMLKHTIC